MQRVFLAVFLVLFCSCMAYADEAPVKKWYVGGGISWGNLTQSVDFTPVDNYYQSLGYFYSGGGNYLQVMTGGRVYVGHRLEDFLDLELGVSATTTDTSRTYKNNAGGTIWSNRTITAAALSLSGLLRPPEGRGHMLFLRFGAHFSELAATNKIVNGTPANIGTIAAGDRMALDAAPTGFGPLLGIGLDFRTGRHGAVRLEYCHFYRLGGTSYDEDVMNLGFHGYF